MALYESLLRMRVYSSDEDLYVACSPQFSEALVRELGFGDPTSPDMRLFGLPVVVRPDISPGAAYILNRRYSPPPVDREILPAP